jgi:hypothetical protein
MHEAFRIGGAVSEEILWVLSFFEPTLPQIPVKHLTHFA